MLSGKGSTTTTGMGVGGPLKQASVLPDLTPLASLELVDHSGAPVKFASAWEHGPAVLVFLRQYG